MRFPDFLKDLLPAEIRPKRAIFPLMITTPRTPTALDDFLFDLNGYLVLKNAVSAELLAALNQAVDQLPPIEMGGWLGNAQRRDYTKDTGLELHNCVELGGPFEELIDHPSWIQYVRRYCPAILKRTSFLRTS